MVDYSDLIGLKYYPEVNDCFQLGRKYFAKLGIKIRDYAFPKDFWLYEDNLYEKYFKKEGFLLIDDDRWEPQIHDVLLVRGAMSVSFPTHAGILVQPNKVLHHYTDRISEEESFKEPWRRPLAILRHKDIVVELPESGEVNILELMPHHVRRRFTKTTEQEVQRNR